MKVVGSRADRMTWNAFDVVFKPWMRRRLNVLTSGVASSPSNDVPLLLVANHVSWWDGFLLREIQRRIRPDSVLYTLALERELCLHPVLRFTGGIGVDPASPASILRALRSFKQKRCDFPRAMFAYFPQGCIAPSFRRPLGFLRGVEMFAQQLAPLTILPVGIHIEPITGLAPTAFVSVGMPIEPRDGLVDHSALEQRVAVLLDDTLAFVAAHGENAVAAWRATRQEVGDCLLHSSASIAGVARIHPASRTAHS